MFSKKFGSQLEKYEDVSGEFSNRQLKVAEWYIRHKLQLGHLLIGILLGWSVLSVGLSLFYWVYYFTYGYFQDQKMMAEQIKGVSNYTALQPMYSARPLQFQGAETFPSATDRYDFVARVINPNERWIANLTYRFVYGGGATPPATTPILPRSERPVIYFGQTVIGFPAGARLEVIKIDWSKVNPHKVDNVEAMVAERINFKLEDFQFSSFNKFSGTNESVKLKFYNDTPFTYWQVDFYVELFSGGQTIGFMYVPVSKFKTQELRSIEAKLPTEGLSVEDVRAYPVVDVFDRRSYILPGE